MSARRSWLTRAGRVCVAHYICLLLCVCRTRIPCRVSLAVVIPMFMACVLCCIATDALGATLHNYLNVGSLINSVLRIKLKTPQ